MLVKVFRFNSEQKVEIDTKFFDTSEGSVKWVNDCGLNGGHIQKPYYVLQCYMDYNTAVKYDLASGQHSSIGISAKVFLSSKDNKEPKYKEGYKYLCELAGRKPIRYTGVPSGQPPCTKKILEELGTEKHLRADIRKRLMDLGYDEDTIRGAFKRLEKAGRISFSSSNHSLKNCEVWAVT